MRRGLALLFGVAATTGTIAAGSAANEAATVVLRSGRFAVAGTRISCGITTKQAIVCSTSVSADPISNSYAIALSAHGTLAMTQLGVLGRSLVYSRGPLELPGASTGKRTTTVRSGTMVLVAKTGLGCTVGSGTLTCASHFAGRSPARGSFGFVERPDGSAAALMFGRPTKTLYAGAATKPGVHNTFTLNLGDVVAITNTRLLCALFRVAGVPALLCSASSGTSGQPLDNSLITAVYADGRVQVLRWANSTQTTLFSAHANGGPANAVAGTTQASYSANLGDLIRVAGTAIGCSVQSYSAGGGDHAFVVCGPDVAATGPQANSLLGTIDQDDNVVVTRLDSSKTPTVIFQHQP